VGKGARRAVMAVTFIAVKGVAVKEDKGGGSSGVHAVKRKGGGPVSD
jgi:hypothetical protein